MTITLTRDPRRLVEQRRNLILNPHPVADTAGMSVEFSSGGAGTLLRETWSGVPAGLASVYRCTLTGTASSWAQMRINEIAASAGRTYTLSAYLLHNMAAASTMRVGILWKDSAGVTILQESGTAPGIPPSAWQRVSFTGVAPAGTHGPVGGLG